MSNDDKDLFHKAMHDVIPLKNSNKIQLKKKTSKIKKKGFAEDYKKLSPLSDFEKETITGSTYLSFCKNGVQPRYFRQLQKGKLPIGDELDLHGATITEARQALLQFLESAAERSIRVVRIIHGKGTRTTMKAPPIKNKVNLWLKQLPCILAFCSCQPKDGGTGALYILLKKRITRGC